MKSFRQMTETSLKGSYFKYEGAIYKCVSYDPKIGYWMQNVDDPKDRRNVSERAIGRTFHGFLDPQTPKKMKVLKRIADDQPSECGRPTKQALVRDCLATYIQDDDPLLNQWDREIAITELGRRLVR